MRLRDSRCWLRIPCSMSWRTDSSRPAASPRTRRPPGSSPRLPTRPRSKRGCVAGNAVNHPVGSPARLCSAGASCSSCPASMSRARRARSLPGAPRLCFRSTVEPSISAPAAGAIAAHRKARVPTAAVIGVDIEARAAACARRNGVSTYEPDVALDGGADGLSIVRRVIAAAGRLLRRAAPRPRGRSHRRRRGTTPPERRSLPERDRPRTKPSAAAYYCGPEVPRHRRVRSMRLAGRRRLRSTRAAKNASTARTTTTSTTTTATMRHLASGSRVCISSPRVAAPPPGPARGSRILGPASERVWRMDRSDRRLARVGHRGRVRHLPARRGRERARTFRAQIATFVGPLLRSAIVWLFAAQWAFGLNSATFAPSPGLLAAVPRLRDTSRAAHQGVGMNMSWRRDLYEGVEANSPRYTSLHLCEAWIEGRHPPRGRPHGIASSPFGFPLT